MADSNNPADTRPSTFVYVDGFNLYYGAVRGTRYKWLNLRALLERILSENRIDKIWYFTARVKAHAHDPGQPIRQQTLIRALETLPGLEVEYGHFRREIRELRRADDMGSLKMLLPKEKGSDVNLATRLMDDYYCDRFDAAVVLSNDSDFAAPIRIINGYQTKPVGLMTPPRWKNEPAIQLTEAAAFRKRISMTAIRECQFPDEVQLDDGSVIHRPPEW